MKWRYPYTALVLCVVAFFVTMLARLAISPIAPLIIDEFGVSKSLIGMALTGMWLAYALAQFPSGVLSGQYGEKRVILAAVGGMSVVAVGLALSPAFAVFVLCCFLLGGFAGLHYPAATVLLTRTFDEAGTVIGIHGFGAPVAGLVTPVAVSWVALRHGWRAALVPVAVIGALVFAAFALRVRPTEPTTPDVSFRDEFRADLLRELLSRKAIQFTVLLGVVTEFITQGLFSFLPTFFVEYHGYSTARAGYLFSGFFLVLAVGGIVVGNVSDRYGRDGTIAGCMVFAGLGSLFLLVDRLWIVLVAVFLIGVGTCGVIVVQSRILDYLSEDEEGTGFGLVRTVYMILGSSGSVTVGFFADRFDWTVSFGFIGLLCAVVLVCYAANWRFELGY